VKAVSSLCAPRQCRKTISVAFEHDGRVAILSADPKYLKQILVNLLTNAVKFTPDGGRLGLTVAAPEGEGVVRFTVWDTGIGIAPENARKLFHAFTQIDSGLTRAQEGTGWAWRWWRSWRSCTEAAWRSKAGRARAAASS